MKVSVVIPAYNEEKMIGRCLASLMAQVEAPLEIIVVDNNCEDSTAEIARSLGARVVHEPEQGMTPARNRGFEEAHGDIIARCDADTVMPGDWVKKIRENFESGQIDALAGPVAYINSSFLPPTPLFSRFLFKFVKAVTLGRQQMLGPNMSLTKDMWLRVRDIAHTPDHIVHEDLDLSLKLQRRGGRMGYDPTLVVETSARRMEDNAGSFFFEYPARFVRTVYVNSRPAGKAPDILPN